MTEMRSSLLLTADASGIVGEARRAAESLKSISTAAADTASSFARVGSESASAAAMSSRLNGLFNGFGAGSKSARDSADAMTAAFKARDAYQALEEAIDPAIRAQREFARAEEIVNQAVSAGVITKADAARSLAVLQTRFGVVDQAATGMFRSVGGGGMVMKNLAYQLNQIGQQGAVTGNYMGAIAIQLPDILASFGFLGVLLGGVAAFAAPMAIELLKGGAAAKTVDEALTDLETSTADVGRAMDAARLSGVELFDEFGSGAMLARELNAALLDLAIMDAEKKVSDTAGAITRKFSDLTSMLDGYKRAREEAAKVDALAAQADNPQTAAMLHGRRDDYLGVAQMGEDLIRNQYHMTIAQAEQAAAAIRKISDTGNVDSVVAGSNELVTLLRSVRDESGKIPDDLREMAVEAGKAAIAALQLKGYTEQAKKVADALASTDLAKPFETAAEAAKRLAEETMRVLKDTQTAADMRGSLAMQEQIAEAELRYGKDSLEVKRLQIEAERQAYEQRVKALQISAEQKQALMDQWDVIKGLASLDPFGTRAAAKEMLDAQTKSVAQLELELSLVGQSEETRRRVLALYQAELEIRRRNIDASGTAADQLRERAIIESDLSAALKRESDAWDAVREAGEGAIDGIFSALRQGDVDGALESLANQISGMFEQLAITNPLKNALFGTDYATLSDAGGMQGIWSRLTGKTLPIDPARAAAAAAVQTVASMQVNAATVMIGGAGVTQALAVSSAGFAGALPGKADVQQQVWAYFSGKGLAPHQVAAIMGNIAGESGFDPRAPGDVKNGVPTSFGLFQHHGARADGLLAALGGQQNLGNVQGQLDYAWRELNTTHAGALKALRAAPDVSSATDAWMRQFERPSDEAMQKSWANRLGAAEQAMAKFGTTTTLATGQLGTMGTGFDKFGAALGSAVQGGGGGGFWGTLFSGIMSGLGIPGFAGGGRHDGGLRIVGENGPELEYTGPSTIVPADLTRRILTGGAPAASTTQIDARPVINITNNSSVPVQGEVQETTDSRGQRRFELVMADAVASGLTAGGGRARRTMRDYYGVNPVGIAR